MRFLIYLLIVGWLAHWGLTALLDRVDAIQQNARLLRQQHHEEMQP